MAPWPCFPWLCQPRLSLAPAAAGTRGSMAGCVWSAHPELGQGSESGPLPHPSADLRAPENLPCLCSGVSFSSAVMGLLRIWEACQPPSPPSRQKTHIDMGRSHLRHALDPKYRTTREEESLDPNPKWAYPPSPRLGSRSRGPLFCRMGRPHGGGTSFWRQEMHAQFTLPQDRHLREQEAGRARRRELFLCRRENAATGLVTIGAELSLGLCCRAAAREYLPGPAGAIPEPLPWLAEPPSPNEPAQGLEKGRRAHGCTNGPDFHPPPISSAM